MRTWKGDVVVVGAGTAGANAAGQFARRGRSVLLLERRPVDRGGAHWNNGIVGWQFDRAGVDRPSGDERVGGGEPIHLRTPFDEPGLVVRDNPIIGVDMGLLGARLRADAVAAGVEVVDRTGSLEPIERDGRLVAVETGGTDGHGALRAEAALFVDASGWRGALRGRSSVVAPWCPPVRPAERCTAADVVFRVADVDGARRQLDAWGARPGEAVNVLGTAGGFSTRSISVSGDLTEVRVLVGCLADGRHGPAARMLTEVRRLHPWIGDRLHGGAGLIPLRRPFTRCTAPGLALVGDAAAQVFPAHGSGVGMGLLAGTTLAEVVGDADDPGEGATVWRYQVEFQRRFGGDLAFYDGFRRHSSAIGTPGVRALLRSGLLTEHLARSGLDQTRGTPRPGDLPGLVTGLARAPRAGLSTAATSVRSSAAAVLASRYPTEPDPAALAAWGRRLDWLVRA
ncbi:MAG: FAD-dependent oxidoreductase [Actinobacteria bacterium]|nr:FAD-dependent oxidoreductase [Actinomycetota bacterium]